MNQLLSAISTSSISEMWMILVAILVSMAVLTLLLGVRREQQYRQIRSRMSNFLGTEENALDDVLRLSFSQRIINPMMRSLILSLGSRTPTKNKERLMRDITMAGNPHNLTTTDMMGIRFLSTILVGVGITFYLIYIFKWPMSRVLMGGMVGFLVGNYLPTYWLNKKIQKRNNAISRALPDALDMLTIVVDAGLDFDAALLKLRERWDNELTREFERVVREQRTGMRKIDALHNLANRTNVAELRAFIAVLVQAERLGISISKVLHVQSQQMRVRRRQKAEEAAAKIPAKMLVPIVIFIFPALFAIILGPAAPAIMKAF